MAEFYSKIHESPHRSLSSDSASVRRDAPTNISVLIVGAGVGGLTCALECWRKGHTVRILERAPCMTTAGDMFVIGLHARRWILNHWPEMAKELEEIGMADGFQAVRKHTGQDLQPPSPFMVQLALGRKLDSYSQLPTCHHLRPLFHGMMYHEIQRLGIEIVYDKRVVEYFEDEATGVSGVITSDGQRETADVVVAADGVGSKSQTAVNGGVEEVKSSGRSIYRAAFPTEYAFADPLVREHYGLHQGKYPIFRVHVGPGIYVMVLTRPDIVAFSFTYPTDQDIRESWHNVVSKETVLATADQYPGFSEALKRLIQAAPPDRIINWPLIWRNPQPQWTSPGGRIVQIGDAAHSMLPTSGNGASQAIEDGISIAACLALGGKSNVPLALKVHNKLRFERVSWVQKLGFANLETLNDKKKPSPQPPSAPTLPSQPSSLAPANPGAENVTPNTTPPSSLNTSPSLSPTDTPSSSPDNSPMPSPGETCSKPLPASDQQSLSPPPAGKPPSGLRSASGRPMMPKWIFDHDPEIYALENYAACAASIVGAGEFTNTNVPPGSTFKPWTLEDMLNDAKNGRPVELDGDWS